MAEEGDKSTGGTNADEETSNNEQAKIPEDSSPDDSKPDSGEKTNDAGDNVGTSNTDLNEQTSADSVKEEKSIPRIEISVEDFDSSRETSAEEIQHDQNNKVVDGEQHPVVSLTPVPGELDVSHSHKDLTEDEPKTTEIEQEMSTEDFQPSPALDYIEEFNRDEAIDSYKVLSTEYEKNFSSHSHLQHKIAEYLAKKKAEDKPDPGRNVTDQEQRFQKCMDALDQLQYEAKLVEEEFESEEGNLIGQCKVKQQEMEGTWKTFRELVLEKCVSAVHSRTGRKLTPQEVEQYLGMLERKDQEVIQVRLENLKLQNRINKLEASIQQKEQLAEGLHMIDFEQLRINNVDLNEKIEDRNEEIHKLQKKVTSTVQVLAHLKEKLQFMQTQNRFKEEQLRELDQEVAKNRDTLNALKHAKDAVRSENIHLKQRGGLVSHPALLRDFEEQIDQRELMLVKLKEIKEKHSDLTLLCNKLKQKIDQAKALTTL